MNIRFCLFADAVSFVFFAAGCHGVCSYVLFVGSESHQGVAIVIRESLLPVLHIGHTNAELTGAVTYVSGRRVSHRSLRLHPYSVPIVPFAVLGLRSRTVHIHVFGVVNHDRLRLLSADGP